METGDADAIRAELRETVAELQAVTERLTRRRNELILAAVQAKVPRAVIAEDAELSEPMIYKIRRDMLGEGGSG
ncbi:hypothetical protein [Nocardia farcinica]|uniref:hypothetical protein n=1 Tax=Nocardia farcinica TaxID=37329 RepID=UPI002458BC83|nr:hypothetical protein [Nocardia farcinica]